MAKEPRTTHWNQRVTLSETICSIMCETQQEECFRLTKSNLKVRPIFHFTPKRIRGHVALCFMSLVTLKKVTEEVQSEAPGTSPAKIVDEVNQMGYSLIEDTKTQKRYRLPSKLTDLGRAIHKALGLVRLTKPQRV